MMANEYRHGSMSLKFSQNDSYRVYRLEGVNCDSSRFDKTDFIPFTLRTSDSNHEAMEGCGSVAVNSWNRCKSAEKNGDVLTLVYASGRDDCLEVTVKLQFVEGADVIKQTNSVKNIGKEAVTLTHFSSALVGGVGLSGLLPWYDKRKIKVHYCLSHWQGEFQWRTDTLEHLGLRPQTAHAWDCTSCRFTSVGSWSTGKYYPMVMLENTETGKVWYIEHEGAYNWTIEIGNKNGKDGGTLFFEANSADEQTGGFVHELKPGETYTASSCVYGCTDGTFEDGVRELLKYKRKTTLGHWDTPFAPACFNDYMNCVWGQPTREKLEPIVDAAASAGCELFCMDAGWYLKGQGNGSWLENDELYGKDGLHGMIEYIASKGMKPGIWLEVENAFRDTQLYKDECVLKRNGEYVNPDRASLNFENKKVREYIIGVFDKLYDMGIRFVKNDYNISTLIGAQTDGVCNATGLKRATDAFYSLIDEVKAKHPDLKIENCGSGAMRCDNGTLSHFELQSTSDQEQYTWNSSIVSGALSVMPPEKAGIWAYPYPISYYENQEKAEIWKDKAYIAKMADGEQTVYNMINALCGTLYLSGRIEHMDRKNFALVKEGVKAFKKYRLHNANGYPVWPCGHFDMGDRSYSAHGILSENKKKLTLAVYRRDVCDDTIMIDLSKYTSKNTKVKLAYPSNPMGAEYSFAPSSGILTVKLPKANSARFFEINI